MTEILIDHIVKWISISGYSGIATLMALESMVAPIPSEAVMPFAGFLIYEGQFSFHAVILFSTLGSVTGSIISYYVGLYGGRPFVSRFGKYFLLNMHHLEMTERFFDKYGDKTIFISRFIPVVRHLISLPAGAGEMSVTKFVAYTLAGAGLWNSFLAYAGFRLRSHWEEIRQYSQVVDLVVVIMLVVAVGFLVYRQVSLRRKGTSNR